MCLTGIILGRDSDIFPIVQGNFQCRYVLEVLIIDLVGQGHTALGEVADEFLSSIISFSPSSRAKVYWLAVSGGGEGYFTLANHISLFLSLSRRPDLNQNSFTTIQNLIHFGRIKFFFLLNVEARVIIDVTIVKAHTSTRFRNYGHCTKNLAILQDKNSLCLQIVWTLYDYYESVKVVIITNLEQKQKSA